MRTRTYFLTLILLLVLLLAGTAATAQLPARGEPGAPDDPRYCGEPERYESGRIKRNTAMLDEFAKVFPCPQTGEPVTSCPGWALDHVLPVALGFCDRQDNIQWLPWVLKAGRGKLPKDRWERKIYHSAPVRVPMPATTLRIDVVVLP